VKRVRGRDEERGERGKRGKGMRSVGFPNPMCIVYCGPPLLDVKSGVIYTVGGIREYPIIIKM